MRPVLALVLLALLTLPAGCGTRVVATPASAPEPDDGVRRAPVVAWDGEGAPPVTVLAPSGPVPAEPWAWCWGSTCADGAPAATADLPDVGPGAELAFSFPEPGWTWEATLHSDLAAATADQGCDRTVPAPVEVTGAHTATVRPAGPAGRWRLDLFGRGPDGGDVITSLLWTTTADGVLPQPGATLSLLTDDDGRLDSWGVELSLTDLDRTPARASATITVTAADGASVTLPEVVAPPGPCPLGTVGTVWITRPARFATPVLDLGPAPYAYDVRLDLDGVVHRARATYPTDLVPDSEPAVALTVDPPLPAWRP